MHIYIYIYADTHTHTLKGKSIDNWFFTPSQHEGHIRATKKRSRTGYTTTTTTTTWIDKNGQS